MHKNYVHQVIKTRLKHNIHVIFLSKLNLTISLCTSCLYGCERSLVCNLDEIWMWRSFTMKFFRTAYSPIRFWVIKSLRCWVGTNPLCRGSNPGPAVFETVNLPLRPTRRAEFCIKRWKLISLLLSL